MRDQTSANTEIGESRVTYYNFHYVVKLAEEWRTHCERGQALLRKIEEVT